MMKSKYFKILVDFLLSFAFLLYSLYSTYLLVFLYPVAQNYAASADLFSECGDSLAPFVGVHAVAWLSRSEQSVARTHFERNHSRSGHNTVETSDHGRSRLWLESLEWNGSCRIEPF